MCGRTTKWHGREGGDGEEIKSKIADADDDCGGGSDEVERLAFIWFAYYYWFAMLMIEAA